MLLLDHVALCDGDTIVSLRVLPDGTATLWWTDGVTGEWLETHASVSVALARLAALVHCGETDWEAGFGQDERGFALRAAEFFGATCV